MDIILEPISLLKSIQIVSNDTLIDDDWMLTRKFLKNGKKIVVSGFGKTKNDALIDFLSELEQESLYL